MKSEFLLKFKNWKDKKLRKAVKLLKNLVDYEKRDEINEFEQKQIDENNDEDKNILVEETKKKEKAIILRTGERKKKKEKILAEKKGTEMEKEVKKIRRLKKNFGEDWIN